MTRFEKTRLHWSSAVLLLLALYALAGTAYSAFVQQGDAILVWIVIAVLALFASFVVQKRIARKRAAEAP